VQARERGYPYARCGCSLYLEDASLLIDTPEDIAIALNNADIKSVDNIMYSHWDPDHTLGMRIMEQLRLEWLDYYENIRPTNPITVYAAPDVMQDLNRIRNKYGAFLDYYEHMGLINRQCVKQPVTVNKIKLSLIHVPKEQAVSIFVCEADGRKLIYAPCDCIPFPDDAILYHADVLILGNTFIGDVLKGGRRIGTDHPVRKVLHSFADALKIKDRFHINRLIITHIEEDWGKSYDDYCALEKDYENVQFAYDGMVIEL